MISMLIASRVETLKQRNKRLLLWVEDNKDLSDTLICANVKLEIEWTKVKILMWQSIMGRPGK